MTPDSKYLPEEIDVERAMAVVERRLHPHEAVEDLLDRLHDETAAGAVFRPLPHSPDVEPRYIDARNARALREWEAARKLQGEITSALRRRDVAWLGAWIIESWERALVGIAEVRYERDGLEAICD